MDLTDLLILGAVFSLQPQNSDNYTIKEYEIDRVKRSHESGAYQDRLSRRARQEPKRLIKVYQVQTEPPKKLNHRLYPDTAKKYRNNNGIQGNYGFLKSTQKPEISDTYNTKDGITLTPDHPVRHFEVYIPHHQRRNVDENFKNKGTSIKHEEPPQQDNETNVSGHSAYLDNDLHETHHVIVPSKNKDAPAPIVQSVKLSDVLTPSHYEVNCSYSDDSHSPIKHDEIHTPAELDKTRHLNKPDEIHLPTHDNHHHIDLIHEEHHIDAYSPKHEEIQNTTDHIEISNTPTVDIQNKTICVTPHVEVGRNNITDLLKSSKNMSTLFYEDPESLESEEINTVKVHNVIENKISMPNSTITCTKQMPELTTGNLKPVEHTPEQTISDDNHHHSFETIDSTHDVTDVAHENVHSDRDHVLSNLPNKQTENSNVLIKVLVPDINKLNKVINVYPQARSNSPDNQNHDICEEKTKIDHTITDGGNKVNKDQHGTIMIQDQNCEEVLERYKPELIQTLAAIGDCGQEYTPEYEDSRNNYDCSMYQPDERGYDEKNSVIQYYNYESTNPYDKPQSIYTPMNYYAPRLNDLTYYNSGVKNEKPKQYCRYNYKNINPDRYKDKIHRTWTNRQIFIKSNTDFEEMCKKQHAINNAKYKDALNPNAQSVIAHHGHYINDNKVSPYHRFRSNV